MISKTITEVGRHPAASVLTPTVYAMRHVPFPYLFLNYNRQIRFANHHAQVLSGYSLVELINLPFSSLCENFPSEDLFLRLAQAQNEQQNTRLNIVSKDNKHIETCMKILPEFSKQNALRGFHVFLHEGDSSEKSNGRSVELLHSPEQLQAPNQIDFGQELVHALKTPLSKFNSSLSLVEGEGHYKNSHDVDNLRKQLNYVVGLVQNADQYLQASQFPQLLDGEQIYIDHILEDALCLFTQQIAEKGLTLKCRFALIPVAVQGHKSWLYIMVNNLLDNALKFTETGTIFVAVHADYERNLVYLIIQDTGVGIEAEDLPHIYTPFFRGQNIAITAVPGTGLGLSIVRKIVEQHNGNIRIDSTINKGTTATITLPLAAWQCPDTHQTTKSEATNMPNGDKES